MNRPDRKELAVIKAVVPYDGCWITSKTIKSEFSGKNAPISGAHTIGQLLSRIGFQKKGAVTSPKMFLIDSKTIQTRLQKIVERNHI